MRALVALKTDRLLVTEIGPEFAAACVTYLRENREHLRPWEPPAHPERYEESYWRDRLAERLYETESGRALPLVFFEGAESTGPIVGTLNLHNIVRGVFQACTVGYNLHHAYQGRGYMSEALAAAIANAFDELHLHRIMLNYHPENERSAAVARRLGFTIEGFAKNYLYIDGRWRDTVLTSRTNPDPNYVP